MEKTKATAQTKWSLDKAHSEIAFKVRHLMIAHVKGAFKAFDASIYTIAKDFRTADINLWIDASSITTGDEKRDEHLKSVDFFDVQNHKQITFTSSTLGNADNDGNHELWGELTIRGITKNVRLTIQFGGIVNDLTGNEKAGFTIIGKINRRDWGLIWNATLETGGFILSEEVTISCEIELTNMGQKDRTKRVEPAGNMRGAF